MPTAAPAPKWAPRGVVCSIDGCEAAVRARGFCARHYSRFRRHGSPLVDRTRRGGPCAVEGCGRKRAAHGYCARHADRFRRHGDPLGGRTAPAYRYVTKDGYVMVRADGHPNADSRGQVPEHVLVMTGVLGRPLRKGETVHHKNGLRADNRPDNLELWASNHPAGQRVSDLIAFALDVLDQYGTDPNNPH